MFHTQTSAHAPASTHCHHQTERCAASTSMTSDEIQWDRYLSTVIPASKYQNGSMLDSISSRGSYTSSIPSSLHPMLPLFHWALWHQNNRGIWVWLHCATEAGPLSMSCQMMSLARRKYMYKYIYCFSLLSELATPTKRPHVWIRYETFETPNPKSRPLFGRKFHLETPHHLTSLHPPAYPAAWQWPAPPSSRQTQRWDTRRQPARYHRRVPECRQDAQRLDLEKTS